MTRPTFADAPTPAMPKRTPQKHATSGGAQTILRALGPHDRARSLAMTELRRRGGSLDAWARSRAAMVEALTHAEDAIEFNPSGSMRPYESTDRAALRAVRRRLESEVFP